IMRFDRADLAVLAQNNLLNDVILHELGHVLGFPTIWSDPMFDLLEGAGTDEPYFTGSAGANRFTLAGGTLINGVGVPVENTGGEGTRDSHWREAVLATELMTGFISTGGNPLSAITIGSLEDIGYQVNYAAGDPYSVPPAAGVMSGWSSLRLEMIEQPMPAPRVVN
ncbi:MAG: leishmanolysin-related zinc metalloendopeptidase, partial [Longimicrobiales bacterium]